MSAPLRHDPPARPHRDAAPAAHAAGGAATRARVSPDLDALVPTIALTALRVMAGLMLMQHGLQKYVGFPPNPARPFEGMPEAFTRPWVAGGLETVGAALFVIGIFTRPVAFVLSGLMAAAYFIAHASDSFWPILNRGELAALYCFVFLLFAAVGGGRWSVDGVLRGRRRAP